MPNVIYGFSPHSCSHLSLFLRILNLQQNQTFPLPQEAGSIHDIQSSKVILSLQLTNYFQQEFAIHKQCTAKITHLEGTRKKKTKTPSHLVSKMALGKTCTS